MFFKSDIDVEMIQTMGGDHMVVAAAKVSTNGSDSLLFSVPDESEKNFGLINYLMKHRHGTPFEHSSMTFYVRAPIFVWREWHRHRIGFSYNEESGRYKKLEPVFYIPAIDRNMSKVESWKPGRPKFLPTPEETNLAVCNNLKRSYELSYSMYEDNLSLEVDPGVARACLPVGIYSGCWVTCNPRSIMSFLSLRTHEPENATFVSYPLVEIEIAARSCEQLFAEGWPLTYKAFCENGRVGP
jgi:thymidylate synthase (FAD)